MRVQRATKNHLDKIVSFLEPYYPINITEDYFNNHDVAVIAVDDKDDVIAFVWIGLSANRKFGYIDYYAIHPDYAGHQITARLGKQVVKVLAKKGVERITGIVAVDEYAERVAVNAQKMGLMIDKLPYFGVNGNPIDMANHIGV